MRWFWLCALMLVWAMRAAALPQGMAGADVVLLGEVHDNPHAHARQAELLRALSPKAVVFEMLTEVQAARVTRGEPRDEAALRRVLGWERSGWPDFSMYYPLFEASREAVIYGAGVPRAAARKAMEEGAAQAFGAQAELYGLARALPEREQAARESLQFKAHCEALPDRLLPKMVAIQRYRDAALARAAVRALKKTGGPVVVIAGNGHVRKDWGVPAYLARMAPEARVFALGLVEPGEMLDAFDAREVVPEVARPDPCEAFEKG
jgi:uncharacterized iron-regulated protein